MNKLKWGNEYSIGIREIDDQHREFITIINKLIWAEDNHYPIELGARFIHELVKYAEFHFVCEENMMYLHAYEGLPAQVAEHGKLIRIMQMKYNEFRAGASSYESVCKFAFMWLISHTTEEDKRFGEFFLKNVGNAGKG
jgi:hemerythrin-like metal-binding protein